MPHSLQNIHNLIDLWLCYGGHKSLSNEHFDFYHCQRWPHRHWFDFTKPIDQQNIVQLHKLVKETLAQTKTDAILPVWQLPEVTNSQKAQQLVLETLQQNGWSESFMQTAMYLKANDVTVGISNQSALKITQVTTVEDAAIWSGIGERAFNYDIDLSVINRLIDQENCHLYLAWQNDTVVASGMLFKTGKVIGVHQVSVDPAFQGQGIAKMFMYNLLDNALELGAKTITLQASPAGYPLYKKLGFIELFDIVSYKRTSNV